MFKVRNLILCATAATTVALCGGCKTAAPKPSGFLSDYSRMPVSYTHLTLPTIYSV